MRTDKITIQVANMNVIISLSSILNYPILSPTDRGINIFDLDPKIFWAHQKTLQYSMLLTEVEEIHPLAITNGEEKVDTAPMEIDNRITFDLAIQDMIVDD
jgi:hypothetical protein